MGFHISPALLYDRTKQQWLLPTSVIASTREVQALCLNESNRWGLLPTTTRKYGKKDDSVHDRAYSIQPNSPRHDKQRSGRNSRYWMTYQTTAAVAVTAIDKHPTIITLRITLPLPNTHQSHCHERTRVLPLTPAPLLTSSRTNDQPMVH